MSRSAIPLVILMAALGVHRQPPADAKIRVEHNAEAFTTKISIQATDGRVAWSDVLRGLARARGNDDSAFEGVLPEGHIDITSGRWRVVRHGLNLVLGGEVRFDVEHSEDAEPQFVVTLDRAALLASKRRFKARLRKAWSRKVSTAGEYGLALTDDLEKRPADRNLVVLVHGLHSSPKQLEELTATIRSGRFPCATFHYPNDQPIADSAKLLARELSKFAHDYPDRNISLVTHSMGGLVSRAVVEDSELDPGNVRKLIMLAPPNHGTALARFAFGLELTEHFKNNVRAKDVRSFYAAIEDGLSEAAADLRPGSPFLQELNARSRNPQIDYTIFLGTGGALSENDLARLRKQVAQAGRQNRWVRFFGPKVHDWLNDLDEVVGVKGDGAVSVERGRLEGVKDTVVMDFGHLSVLRAPQRREIKNVHKQVLKRLKSPTK